MKNIILILFILVAFILLLSVIPERSDADIAKDLCLQKGGVPIMNWNNSALKDCKLKF